MYYPAITAAFFLASPFLVAADCTSFKDPKVNQDLPNDYSNMFMQTITTLACPSSSQTPCTIPQIENFNLTIPPQFSFQMGIPGLTLSQADNSSIVALASQAYSSYGDGQAQPFATHSVILSTLSIPQNTQQEYLSVDPGTNKTLFWSPFFMYAEGILEGCDNSTLNGLAVTVGAAYLSNTNGTGVVTGMWDTGIENITATSSAPATGATATPSSTAHPDEAPIVTSIWVWSGLLLTLSLLGLV